jgi:hypothetical protein
MRHVHACALGLGGTEMSLPTAHNGPTQIVCGCVRESRCVSESVCIWGLGGVSGGALQ